jgi:hypothetical protein
MSVQVQNKNGMLSQKLQTVALKHLITYKMLKNPVFKLSL